MLYVAAGGPGDLGVASVLAVADPNATFATFLWRRDARRAGPIDIDGARGVKVDGLGLKVRPSAHGPEHCILANHLNGALYCLDTQNLDSTRATLAALLSRAGGEVVVVDTGGDILCGRESPFLRSPLLESVTLRVLEDLGALSQTQIVIAGIGLDNEISVEEAERRFPRSMRRSWLFDQEYVGLLLGRLTGLTSETSRLWMHAVLGLTGRVWTDSTGRPVPVTRGSSSAMAASPSDLWPDSPYKSIRNNPRTLEEANEDLVRAGFVDELAVNANRRVVLSSSERARFASGVTVGDYVTDRFRKRTRLDEHVRLTPTTAPLSRVVEILND